MLNADGRSCDGKCEDICYNTAGSYRCLCSEGYVLNADGRSCDGKYLLLHDQVLQMSVHRLV